MQRSDLHIPVIYYHSVGIKNSHWVNNFLTLDLPCFEDQLKYFRKHFNLISLSEFFNIRMGLRSPVKNALVITFDDGYLDNWIWAFPIIKKYGVKATIFVSPEFVDPRPFVRPNLEDVWAGRASQNEITRWGFLSWDEMRLMESSGLVDIQSHTMSHTKFFTSDLLAGFHPGSDSFYATCNLAPERKPYYISDSDFNRILPYGYPLFEEASAVIARKVEINSDFTGQCIEILKDYDFTHYDFDTAKQKVASLYRQFKDRDELIVGNESEEEYLKRAKDEIYGSKKIIEENLNKKVEFLCWPHGDNNKLLHQIALDSGYLMTTIGKADVSKKDMNTRITERLGVNFSSWRKKQKTIFKLKAISGKIPYYLLISGYRNLFRIKK